jgi:hypothetical protein
VSRRLANLARSTTAAALAAAVVVLLAVSSAVAHEGGPRLILEPNPVNPGGVVLIRGEDLALDEAFRVSLVGDVGHAELGPVTTDGEGHFTLAAEMPVDTPAGTYAIQAMTESGFTVTSLVRIDGVAVQPEQAGAPPGQDEGFPAPGANATAPPVAAPASSAVPAAGGSTLRPLPDPATAFDPVPFVALAGAVGALGLLVWRTRRPAIGTTGSADSP